MIPCNVNMVLFRLNSRYCLILLCVTVFLVGGCQQGAVTQNNYHMEAVRGKEDVNQKIDGSVRIARLGYAQPYGEKLFVYKKSSLEFETDYYNEFIAFPADIIQGAIYDWFVDAGTFNEAIRWDDVRKTDFELKGYLKALYGDFSEKGKQSAVMELELEIVNNADETSRFKKSYASEKQFDSRSSENLVQAYGQCLTEILTQFESDLAGVDF